MLLKRTTAKLLFLVAYLGPSNAASASDIVWSSTGGGWRSMAASSAFAHVFARLGLLEDSSDTSSIDTPKIGIVTTTSGASWWSAQFFYSQQYHSAITDGSPSSLGRFTRSWFEAYASMPLGADSCGPLEDLCSDIPKDEPDFLSALGAILAVANHFNFSWPVFIYKMFEATSKVYDDSNFVNVRASDENKLPMLESIDVCVHTSLMPNARAFDANTITYLAQDYNNPSKSYAVPLPYDWCVGDQGSEWLTELPGGNVFPGASTYADFAAQTSFPLYPSESSDGFYVTPQDGTQPMSAIPPQSMTTPFGGTPTAVQISAASSAAMAALSPDVPSVYAAHMSLLQHYGIEALNATDSQKSAALQVLDKLLETLWTTGILGNAATNSAWADPDPKDMPDGQKGDYWFGDGAFTDGPSVASAISRYQRKHGNDGEIKVILSNNKYTMDNFNNVLGYFSTTWNQGVEPGEFIWPMGVGAGPQSAPQQSKQIFQEYLDEEKISAMSDSIDGTNATWVAISATTVNNDAFGIAGGQRVAIALINLNSDVPTQLISKPVIDHYTPDIVAMVESIAGSEDLADKINSFVRSESFVPKASSGLRGTASVLSIN